MIINQSLNNVANIAHAENGIPRTHLALTITIEAKPLSTKTALLKTPRNTMDTMQDNLDIF